MTADVFRPPAVRPRSAGFQTDIFQTDIPKSVPLRLENVL